ncbi:flagellar hook-associated protein FlgL [Microaerobacter geothermalis]|uniref:flagellar hook-associated protein FlgL n=1 Tax=Microaerobacter geothermalis TaxID=674972 RepID=UPI001F1E704E|nr:flagellar hook-associated protein FlgL [Microaerobacter geothermalis]MCF6093415.1 flagellar hook-associated protein FlgL [Microaerobacter geothermalis]
MSLRITQSMLNNDMLRNLSKSYRTMGKYQDQLASGKKINKPSDDPVVAARGMFYRSQLMEIEQFQRNVNEAQNWMEITDTSMGEANDVLQRARELLIQASNDTYAQGSIDAIAAEIEQLKGQLGTIANASIGGRYIFNGTLTKSPPYDTKAGKWASQTSSQDIRLEMNKGIYLAVNVVGNRIFANPSASDGMFGLLDKIVNDLRSGDKSQLGNYLSQLDDQIDNLLSERAALGARINRIELVKSRLDAAQVNTTKLMSNEEDADIAKVITDLKAQENVHRAALSAGARIIQPSLVDFIR